MDLLFPMDKIPLNFALLGNPWNWIIILLMVYIVGLALSLVFHRPLLQGALPQSGI